MNGEIFVNDVRVEVGLNRIHADGGMIQLEPKIMQVLVCLARSPGQVVSKDALINAVWPETSASDDVLARAISELRKAFGDNSQSQQVIETIRKGGYRLLGSVTTVDARAQRAWLSRGAIVALVVITLMSAFLLNRPNTELPGAPKTLPLTSLKGVERDPAISPNGALVAFSWNGPDQDNWDIYVKLRGEETPQRLTQSSFEDGSPAWSPGGDRIAFRRRTDTGCEIIVVPAIGGAERLLATCTENNFADLTWSSDGRQLAHNDAVGGGSHAIVLIDAASGEKVPITEPPTGIWGDYDPSFSPDGSQLAFARALSEGIQDIYVTTLNSDVARRVTFDNRNIYGLTWTPDGKAIVFGSNREGDYDIWRVASEGGTPKSVLAGPGSLVNPVLDRSGSTLIYEHRSYDTDLWRYQLTPAAGDENPSVAASSTRWELYPSLSSSGRRIAYASDRSGSYEIWVSDIDGASARRLTDFGGPLASGPSWAPDDTRLAFDARPDGNADIYLIDPAGGKPLRLTEDAADDVAPSWSVDGHWVLFASNRSGRWQVWHSRPDGSEVEQVTHDGGFRALETSRGLFYTRFGEAGLWSLKPAGEQKQFDFPAPVDWGNWQAGDAGIYRIDRAGGGSSIVLHPWEGESRELFTTAKMIPVADAAFVVSRDGQTIVYGQIEQRWVDLVSVSPPPL